MRKVAICANMSVLAELPAKLATTARGGGECFVEALRQLFFLEYAQRRFSGAALGSHVLAQLRRRLVTRAGELGRAEHAVLRQAQRIVGRNARALGKDGELLDQPE